MSSQPKAVQKMYLLNAQQMSRLNSSHPLPVPAAAAAPSVGETLSQNMRRVAETELDEKMRAVLNEQGLNPYDKIKKYNALLQRYLRFIKQDIREEGSPRPPPPPVDPEEEEEGGGGGGERPSTDEMAEEVLQNLPPRDRKNASFILKKIGSGGWNSKGEFIDAGKTVRGSHIIDLIKYLTSSYNKAKKSPPRGWSSFLNALSELNIPVSSVNNPEARQQYRRLRETPHRQQLRLEEEEEEEEDEAARPSAPTRWSTPRVPRSGRKRRGKKIFPWTEYTA